MPSLDAAGIGHRVAEARGRAGLTQHELAAAVEIDRSALAKIETGARRVSALELVRLADATGERIEWFVQEVPPAIMSRRNLRDPGTPSPAIDRLVERLARDVEFLAQHDPAMQLHAATLHRPTSHEEAEQAAREVRRLLGLDEVAPILEISARAGELGLLVFSVDLGNDAADGASILLETGGVAVVNGQLQVGRRRLTAAHELGHYLFADEFTVDWRVAELDDPGRWEARVDRFARAVLLPSDGLRREWERWRETAGDLRTAAVKVASQYRVDMSTLARRLLELRIGSPDDVARIRTFRTTKADIVEHGLVIGYDLSPPELPRRYQESVLRLYRQEVVSAVRALELLLDTYEEADLPELPELREDEIWAFVS